MKIYKERKLWHLLITLPAVKKIRQALLRSALTEFTTVRTLWLHHAYRYVCIRRGFVLGTVYTVKHFFYYNSRRSTTLKWTSSFNVIEASSLILIEVINIEVRKKVIDFYAVDFSFLHRVYCWKNEYLLYTTWIVDLASIKEHSLANLLFVGKQWKQPSGEKDAKAPVVSGVWLASPSFLKELEHVHEWKYSRCEIALYYSKF